MKLWRQVFVATIRAGRQAMVAEEYANFAVSRCEAQMGKYDNLSARAAKGEA